MTPYVYDPENRIQTTAGTVYTYDADGQRVLKSNTSGTALKTYWMGNGNVLAEADGAGVLTAEYIYFNGKRIARIDQPANTVHYYLSDHLGSSTKIISSAGVVEEESDFTAFGSELSATSGANHYKFTSKERDSETGLDYFGARFYSNGLGRWTSPDPKGMALRHLLNPQKLNKYAYVLNNPAGAFDPDGMEEVTIQFRAFIPQANVGGFRGDNRSFSADKNASSRTSVTVKIETDPAKNHGNPMIGQPQVQISPTHLNLTGSEKTSTGPQMPKVTATQDKNGSVTVNIQENMRNPFTPVGSGIKSDVNVTVNQDATHANVQGKVSGSPSFETNFSVDGSQNQNVPLQTAPQSTVGFTIGLQQPNEVKQSVDLQKPKKEDQK